MSCCGSNPMQGKMRYEKPAILASARIGYDSLGIADLVGTKNYSIAPPRLESSIPPRALYGVPSSKQGSGNYANNTFPVTTYMPMDAGYAHMPSFGSGGAGG